MRIFQIDDITIGSNSGLVLIAGPCVIESRDHCFLMAEKINEIATKNDVPLIFKASYDKANRSSIKSYRGPGIDYGLEILSAIKEEYSLPISSDVHSVEEVKKASEVLDVIQIPAFLCRQTDLLIAAGKSGKPVNVKKGQFLAPWDMKNVVEKIEGTGNEQILLTERGSCFGYNYLVSDLRSLVIMRSFGYPVVYDATHSVQMPGGQGISSGGENQYVHSLSRAAVAVGIDVLFVEIHDRPEKALSDGKNMLNLDGLASLLSQVKAIDSLVKEQF